MSKIALVSILIYTSSFLFAQQHKLPLTFEMSTDSIGTYLSTEKYFPCKKYLFSRDIHSYYVDTTTNDITAQVRFKKSNGEWDSSYGLVVMVDTKKGRIKWRKSINFLKQRIFQIDGFVVKGFNKRYKVLKHKNGKKGRLYYTQLCFVEPTSRNVIGYNDVHAMFDEKCIEARDIETGKVNWVRDAVDELPWEKVQYLNDSILIVEAEGLHTYNIYTGKGWDYKAKTITHDYTEMCAVAIVGVASFFVFGVAVIPTVPDIIYQVSSNVLTDDNYVYYASNEKIVQIDHVSGDIKWSTQLDKRETSQSFLFSKDDFVCMVNRGAAIMGLQHVYYGIPFVASFDKKTGKKRFQKNLDNDFGHIIDYTIQGDTLALILETSMHFISLKNGSVLSVKDRPDNDLSMMSHFVDKSSYLLSNNSDLVHLNNIPHKNYLNNGENQVLELDYNWRMVKSIPYSSIYYPMLKLKDHWIMYNENVIITDNNMKIIAEFDLSDHVKLIGKKLYGMKGKDIYEIDISEIYQ